MTLSVHVIEAKTIDRLSPQFNCTPDGPTSTRYFQVQNYGDLLQARYEIMGYPVRTGAGVLSRKLPMREPEDQNCWAVNCGYDENCGAKGYQTVTVDGMPVNVPNFHKSVLRVDFAIPPYDVHDDDHLDTNGEYGRFVEVQEDGQCDVITSAMLESVMKWTIPGISAINGKSAAPIGISQLNPYANVTIIWHQVPYIYYPRATIRDSYGKVSKVDLGAPGDRNFYAKGTLLFLGCRRRRYAHCHPESTGIGQAVVDLQYFFRHDDNGYFEFEDDNLGPNTFPCFLPSTVGGTPLNRRVLITTDGVFHDIGDRADGTCVYDEFDPNLLFKVE